MAAVPVHRRKKTIPARKKAPLGHIGKETTIAAGEFKAKCLAIIDDVNETGQEVIITKRGKPTAKLIPFPHAPKSKSIIGRLEGIMKINGDPDDLVKPIFPEEDWDMLK